MAIPLEGIQRQPPDEDNAVYDTSVKCKPMLASDVSRVRATEDSSNMLSGSSARRDKGDFVPLMEHFRSS